MRFIWGRGAALTALAASVVAASSFAGAQSALKVDVNLKDADMLVATKTLTSKTGIQFLVEPSTEPFAKITLQVKDVTPDEAIKYICQAAGAEFRRDEHGVYVIGHHKDVMLSVPVDAPKAPAKKETVLRKVRIMKADARDVCDMLVNRTPYNPTRGFEVLKDFVRATSPTGSGLPQASGVQFYGNNNATAQTFRPTAAAPSGAATLPASEMSNQIALPGSGESAGQIGGFGGGGQGNLGGGGQGNPGGGLGQGNGQGGGQGTQLIGGQGLVPDGIDFVSYDPTDNSLVVQGTEEAYTELLRTIDLFDRAPQQVLIKVEFITTTEGTNRSFGTEFQYQRGTVNAGTSPGSFVRSGDPVYLNFASGNVVGRLRASLTETNGKVVNAPILRTMNNQPASIQADVTQYVFINQLAATGNVVVNVPVPYPITAQTRLTVAPRINADNTITLFLQPQIQAFVGTSIGPDGQEFPNQTNQFLSVVARVKNGETMVIGGLTAKSDNGSVNRVPVLSEIPIIGQFFRTNNKSKTDSELLIFVTPTIVDEDTTGNPGGP